MRKRKYLIGATLALAMCLAVPVAQAAPTSQTLTVKLSPTKQQKKVSGGASIDVIVATTYVFPQVGVGAQQTASNTVLDFDKGLAFDTGNLPRCNPTRLASTTTQQADAACGPARVGSGDAVLCPFSVGCGAKVDAIVSAYNGTPVNGNPSILLHTKTNTPAAPTVLQGTLIRSPVGGKFGSRLDVTVPDTATTGLTLTNFHTNIPKKITVPAKKKGGRVVKAAKYYVNAKCTDKVWDFQETTTFRAGGGTQSDSTTQACKQKPAPKK
jgi:hypothetical protein